MPSRREILLAPAVLLAARSVAAADGKMTLALHQNTSARAGYRASLEGWARAGIKEVEITNNLLDGFLKTDSLTAARRVLTDLGLTPSRAHAASAGSSSRIPNGRPRSTISRSAARCGRARPAAHLLHDSHIDQADGGRLQTGGRQRPRGRRSRQAVQIDGDVRVRAPVHLRVNLDHAAVDHARRRASERRPAVRLLSLTGPA